MFLINMLSESVVLIHMDNRDDVSIVYGNFQAKMSTFAAWF